MQLVSIVAMLAIAEYMVFGALVGMARGKYGVEAPATSGHPIFERYYRVQENTLEQLIALIPAMVVYGYYGNEQIAAVLGVVFIIARIVYLIAYVKNPSKRGLGFLPGWLVTLYMMIAGIIAAFQTL